MKKMKPMKTMTEKQMENNKVTNNSSGIVHLGILAVFFVVGAVAVVVVLMTGKNPVFNNLDLTQSDQVQVNEYGIPEVEPVSDSTDIEVLETEIENTYIGEIEQDLEMIETEMSDL